jgi:hypothetical protein
MKYDWPNSSYATLFDLSNPMAICKYNVNFCWFELLYFNHDQNKNKMAVEGGDKNFLFRVQVVRDSYWYVNGEMVTKPERCGRIGVDPEWLFLARSSEWGLSADKGSIGKRMSLIFLYSF